MRVLVKTYMPVWTGPIEGYATKYVSKNLWRVRRHMEFEDLMQEAYIVFLRVAKKYPDLDTPSHFMSLFKTSLSRMVTDAANLDTCYKAEITYTPQQEDDEKQSYVAEPVGELANAGELMTLLRQAPAEVAAVVNLFLNTPTEVLQLALDGWTGGVQKGGVSPNRKICQLLGFPKDLEVLEMVRAHFQLSK